MIGIAFSWQMAFASDPKCEGSLAPVSTQTLRQLIDSSNPTRHSFVKNAPIYVLRVRDFDSIPEFIRQHLGSLDQTSYSEQALADRLGGVIVLQMNNGAPDFYPVTAEAFSERYRVVDRQQVLFLNPKLDKALRTSPEIVAALENSQLEILGALRTRPVTMVRSSDLGYPLEMRLEIDAPWGGTQVRSDGQDAYIVVGDEIYMVNLDPETGLPAGYVSP